MRRYTGVQGQPGVPEHRLEIIHLVVELNTLDLLIDSAQKLLANPTTGPRHAYASPLSIVSKVPYFLNNRKRAQTFS